MESLASVAQQLVRLIYETVDAHAKLKESLRKECQWLLQVANLLESRAAEESPIQNVFKDAYDEFLAYLNGLRTETLSFRARLKRFILAKKKLKSLEGLKQDLADAQKMWEAKTQALIQENTRRTAENTEKMTKQLEELVDIGKTTVKAQDVTTDTILDVEAAMWWTKHFGTSASEVDYDQFYAQLISEPVFRNSLLATAKGKILLQDEICSSRLKPVVFAQSFNQLTIGMGFVKSLLHKMEEYKEFLTGFEKDIEIKLQEREMREKMDLESGHMMSDKPPRYSCCYGIMNEKRALMLWINANFYVNLTLGICGIVAASYATTQGVLGGLEKVTMIIFLIQFGMLGWVLRLSPRDTCQCLGEISCFQGECKEKFNRVILLFGFLTILDFAVNVSSLVLALSDGADKERSQLSNLLRGMFFIGNFFDFGTLLIALSIQHLFHVWIMIERQPGVNYVTIDPDTNDFPTINVHFEDNDEIHTKLRPRRALELLYIPSDVRNKSTRLAVKLAKDVRKRVRFEQFDITPRELFLYTNSTRGRLCVRLMDKKDRLIAFEDYINFILVPNS